MYLRHCFLPLALLFSTFCALRAQAHDGWKMVGHNDFVGARTAFEAALRQNPRDEAALVGALFVAETRQDHETYAHCSNQLVVNTWAPHHVWLFGHMYEGSHEAALAQKLPESLRLPYRAARADSLFGGYRAAEAYAQAQQIAPDWKWSIVGPFDNVSGSGYLAAAPVEGTPFEPTRVFQNAHQTEFAWLRYALRPPGGTLNFERLPRKNGLATYYANAFLHLPTARRVALGITRNEPIKIWLDDQLLFESPRRNTLSEYDSEVLTFDLPAGAHRLLVKISEFPEEATESRISLFFNDLKNNRGESEEEGDDDYRPTAFLLRLMDPSSGLLFDDVRTDYEATYTPAAQPWPTTLQRDFYLDFFVQKALAAPTDLCQQYLLAKAFAKCGATERGEEYFAAYAAAWPEAAFGKFLLAKFYAANDKAERAEALLSELDTSSAPTMAAHFVRFLNVNKEQEEAQYVSALEGMLGLSPTHWPVMNRYLSFLKEKGRKEQVQRFVRGFLEQNKDEKWRDRLEEYLEEDSYKPKSYQPKSDREREKEFKKAKKNLKKNFNYYDLSKIIEYYKYKEQVADVLRAYDESLAEQPWSLHQRYNKARYLFEKGRTDEALPILLGMLEFEPYDDDVHEMLGDIFIEKKDNAEALKWYRKAERANGARRGYGALAGKIEKLENKKKYNGYFPALHLIELAKDRSWEAQFPDEEAVISLFAVQTTYNRATDQLESVRRAIIHIRNDAGAKNWTEANLRPIGQITSAKVLKRDGSVTSPDLGYGVAVFKNLQAGDVILVEGTLDLDLPDEIPNELVNIHITSWQAPVARATFELLAPRDEALYFTCNRIECAHTTRDTGDFKMLTWDWRDLPKVEAEEAMPSNYDAYAWLMTATSPDWGGVVKWYEQKTYCRTEPNYEVLAQARALLRPGMSEAEIFETLHTFIVKDINYSFVPFLNTNYVPKKPGATLSAKVGDCKDVATLMIALLREQGIPAWYTLVSTHSFSNQEPRPTIYIFNHAIVAYQLKDSVLRFADLTTDYFPTGVLPDGDCGAWGLVVRAGETQLRRLPNHALDPRISRIEIQAQAQLDGTGNLSLDVQTTRHGTNAGHWRERLLRATAEERRKQMTDYFGGGVLNHLDLVALDFYNLDSLNAPLRAHFELKAYNQLEKVSNLHIMPLPLPLSIPTQKALFALKRYNDLDLDELFELAPVRETVDLALPAGFDLAEMPQNQRFETEFGDYSLQFEKTQSGLRIQRELAFKQRFVHHADFENFKKFYLNVLDGDDLLLALKRTGADAPPPSSQPQSKMRTN
jgi:thioredoxin-like negative regulator of GroEL